ncbi:hypothetical protein [Pelagicoccus sp. SDUM812002]|uniref:hypothetical protein n=1 Tax=Pelagicoccus sp. SDUM812002 TaxID=3041266 RepID=UPI00280ED0DF|nr:hypothetical protein [Pelagicoccus sp. SDUM812002]MDQ8188533.1 hypothetical protein [Pelagicoccus sp. SDUM812002]
MSYQLAFWKYGSSPSTDHSKIYQQLMDEELPDSVEELPIEEIRKEIDQKFSKEWKEEFKNFYSKEDKVFEVSTNPKLLLIDCRGLEGEEMNDFIDLAGKFGCSLYDPQTEQRYEG